MSDPAEEGVLEGFAVEASTGTKYHFAGHYIVVGTAGHYAVGLADSRGEHLGRATGTVAVNGAAAHEAIVNVVKQIVVAGTWQRR